MTGHAPLGGSDTAVRNWLAGRLWNLAHRLYVDPDDEGERCPDCNLAPYPAEGETCDVCDANSGEQARYSDAYEAGRMSAYESMREMG